MTASSRTTINWLITTLLPSAALSITLLTMVVAVATDTAAGTWSWPRVGVAAVAMAGLLAMRRTPTRPESDQ